MIIALLAVNPLILAFVAVRLDIVLFIDCKFVTVPVITERVSILPPFETTLVIVP